MGVVVCVWCVCVCVCVLGGGGGGLGREEGVARAWQEPDSAGLPGVPPPQAGAHPASYALRQPVVVLPPSCAQRHGGVGAVGKGVGAPAGDHHLRRAGRPPPGREAERSTRRGSGSPCAEGRNGSGDARWMKNTQRDACQAACLQAHICICRASTPQDGAAQPRPVCQSACRAPHGGSVAPAAGRAPPRHVPARWHAAHASRAAPPRRGCAAPASPQPRLRAQGQGGAPDLSVLPHSVGCRAEGLRHGMPGRPRPPLPPPGSPNEQRAHRWSGSQAGWPTGQCTRQAGKTGRHTRLQGQPLGCPELAPRGAPPAPEHSAMSSAPPEMWAQE